MLRRPKAALVFVALALWLGLVRLCVAFLNSELDWVTVASFSRRDAPWYYRLAGVWGGLEGSLYLFTTILATIAVLATIASTSRLAVTYSLGIVVSLAAIGLAFVNPFRTLAMPAIGGFGLTPILEHPAMAIHPPLLYLGLACTLPACLAAFDNHVVHARRWLLVSLACVVLAMALGGLWSYIEQGWGGYWAWDPVENTSLMVWLAVLIAIHTQPRWPDALGRMLLMLPWLLTLMGACIVRSGSTPSIHGFGQRASVGWSLLAITGASVVLFATLARRQGNQHPRVALRSTAMNIRLAAIILLITLTGTLAPLLVDLFTSRPAAVRGRFYSGFIGPAAVVAVPFLIARLRRTTSRGWLAHAGALVLVVGIAASTFDTSNAVIVGPGATVHVAGLKITNLQLRVEDGPRQLSTAVVAVLDVDGTRMYPARVAYRDRGGQLNENDIDPGLWRDVQLQLDSAIDVGTITLTVYTRPLMWLVWLGAAMIATGALFSGRRRVAVPELDVAVFVPADR